MEPIRLIISIVERGKGVAMQNLYAGHQIFLHLQCVGTGTATSEILDILGLGSSEKDVVVSYASASMAAQLLYDLDNDLRGSTKTTGIVFDLPLTGMNNMAAAMIDFHAQAMKKGNGGEPKMDQNGENRLILVACNRGFSEAVMATAKTSGARGGTVVKARLAGLQELERAYDIDMTAEREIVAIVVTNEQCAPMLEAINEAHGLRSKAQAISCSLPIGDIVRLG